MRALLIAALLYSCADSLPVPTRTYSRDDRCFVEDELALDRKHPCPAGQRHECDGQYSYPPFACECQSGRARPLLLLRNGYWR